MPVTAVRIPKKRIAAVAAEARRAARREHAEVCGLLVDNGHTVDLIAVKNIARRGAFRFEPRQTAKLQRAIKALGYGIAGTYHSHPISHADPGPGDIANAFDGDLMLILDVCGKTFALWRIQGHSAYPVKAELV